MKILRLFASKSLKWSDKVTNEVLERKGMKRAFLRSILRRKTNCIGRILRRKCLLHDAIEGQETELKEVGRKIAQLLDDLKNRKKFWELNEQVEDRKCGNDNLSSNIRKK